VQDYLREISMVFCRDEYRKKLYSARAGVTEYALPGERSYVSMLLNRRSFGKARMGVVSLMVCLLGSGLFASTDVTSQEQFNRLTPGGLPGKLHYNADRASLELRADEKTCPLSSRGFFELNINPQGEVIRARDVRISVSSNLRSMAVKWVKDLLMQIRFRPLKVGSKTTSVHTFATVFCD
jgi:hypothetical protein